MIQPGAPKLSSCCPECGTPARALPAHRPRWRSWLHLIPIACILFALVWVARKNYQHWPALPPPIPRAVNILTVEFPEHRFIFNDIQAIARGEGPHRPLVPPRFADASMIFPERELTATFNPPAGDYQRRRRYGWPLNILSYRISATYEDVYTLDTIALSPRPRAEQGWLGWAHIQQHVNQRGELVSRIFMPEAIAANILLVALAWCAGALSVRVLRCVRILRPDRSPRIVAAIRLMPVLAIVIASIVLSLRPYEEHGLRMPPVAWPATAPTGLTARDILDADQPDVAIASAILAAPGLDEPAGFDPDGVLLLGWQSSAPIAQTGISRGWPVGLLSITQFTLSEQARRNPHRRLPLRWQGQTLKYDRLHLNDSGTPTYTTLSLSLRPAAIILLLLVIAWTTGLLAASIIRLVDRRRQHSRLHNTLCLHCAYDLSALTPTTPTSPNPS